MSGKILLIDDDAKILLDYFVDELQKRGYQPEIAISLSEAKRILDDPEHSRGISCAILDIIFPLSEEDDPIAREFFKRDPTGPEDAMKAGLALIQILSEKGIPILVLTHLSRRSPIGSKIWQELKKLELQGVIKYAAEKPADDDFYNALKKVCGRQDD